MMSNRFFQVLLFAALSGSLSAAVLYQDLGTTAPPASVAGQAVAPFALAPQQAISDFSNVAAIPGSPIGGSLGVSPQVNKRTIGSGWASWSHGYTGPIYYSNGVSQLVLTLPSNCGVFYFYAEPNVFAVFNITATTDSGATSGPVQVNGVSGARGFAFYTTAGESIATITINCDAAAQGFAIAEFGAAVPSGSGGGGTEVPASSTLSLIATLILIGGAMTFVFTRRAA